MGRLLSMELAVTTKLLLTMESSVMMGGNMEQVGDHGWLCDHGMGGRPSSGLVIIRGPWGG